MDRNPRIYDQPASFTASSDHTKFITNVYAWMGGALALTGLTAMYVYSNEALLQFIFSSSLNYWLLIGAELALVFYLTAAINRMSSQKAMMYFLVYSAINGITMSSIFLMYTASSIASTFFITAGTFGAMSLYGYTTKTDLTKVGNIAIMGVMGLIIASLVNIFLQSEMIYWATSFIGVAVFTGLTAYDTQKIKQMAVYQDADSEAGQKTAIIGALMLYLDFINLFLMLLRFFGRRD
ncbi:MAG: Inner membrane protein YbhL [Flavobacteriia bacterium]|nr:MAG: Inner membrane protein YbhL [Flavobacteriia bacterium]